MAREARQTEEWFAIQAFDEGAWVGSGPYDSLEQARTVAQLVAGDFGMAVRLVHCSMIEEIEPPQVRMGNVVSLSGLHIIGPTANDD